MNIDNISSLSNLPANVKEKLLSNEMHGKFYQRKPNNPNGLLPSQMRFVKSSILKMPIDLQAHILREQEKRAS